MTGTNDVQLLASWASPYSNRIQMALKLKSIEHEYIHEEIHGTKSELLLKSNPVQKKIPVLIHGGKPVCESLVIIQYIDEVWTEGPSILPLDPYDRATARFWATYIDQTWFPTFMALGQSKASGEEETSATIAKISDGVGLLEEAFVKSSKGKAFFGGDNIGYLDIVLGSFLGWIKAIEMAFGRKILDDKTTPGLASWSESFLSHDDVKEFIAPPQKLLEHYMSLQASGAAVA